MRLGLLRNEAAGDPVRHVVERCDRLLDSPLRLGIDAVAAVDDPGDGHGGNAGFATHIPQRYGHRIPPVS